MNKKKKMSRNGNSLRWVKIMSEFDVMLARHSYTILLDEKYKIII